MAATDLYQDPLAGQKKPQPQQPNPNAMGSGLNLADDSKNYAQSLTTGNAGSDVPQSASADAPPPPQATTPHDQIPTAPTTPPASAGSSTMPAGWEDAGNGMAKNPATGQMLPTNHPEFQKLLTQAPAAPGAPGAPTATDPGGTSLPPPQPPSNPPPPPPGGASEDLYLKALSERMGQSAVPGADDAAVKAQLDPIRAENQRALEGEIRNGAEAGFEGGSTYGANERLAAAGRMGEKNASAAGQIIGHEVDARRAEIQDALTKYGAQMNDEQRQQLQRELAQLEAETQRRGQDINKGLTEGSQQIQREGLTQTGQLGNRELDIRDRGLTQSGNLDLIRSLISARQGDNSLAAQLGLGEAGLNAQALSALLGG